MRQCWLQGASVLIVLSVIWPYFLIRNEPVPWLLTAFAIGCTALLLSLICKQPWWWKLIHFSFAPLAYAISLPSLNPNWFLLAFLLTLLVYRGAATEQVPLYLTNTQVVAAISRLCAKHPQMRFIDLGAGVGSTVRPLAKYYPEAHLEGVENAPATWLIGRLLTWRLKNCSWRFKSIWETDLGKYDVVYAFLSPAPMPQLWYKVQREMHPGALFISNSFPAPDAPPTEIVTVDDNRKTTLYCYQR